MDGCMDRWINAPDVRIEMSENDSEFSFVYFKFLSVLKLRKCVPSFKKYFPFTSYYLK